MPYSRTPLGVVKSSGVSSADEDGTGGSSDAGGGGSGTAESSVGVSLPSLIHQSPQQSTDQCCEVRVELSVCVLFSLVQP